MDSIIFHQHSFGLILKIFNTIDMILTLGKHTAKISLIRFNTTIKNFTGLKRQMKGDNLPDLFIE